jgi:hypothetical protein
MKKLLLGVLIVVIASVYGSSNQKNIYYFKKNIPKNIKYTTNYRVKISSNRYLKSSKKIKKASKYNAYILKGSKYYSVYIGSFKYKKSAKKRLKEIRKRYKGAYIIETYTPKKKRKKARKIKVVKIKKAQSYFQ